MKNGIDIILENSVDLIFIFDSKGIITNASKSVQKVLGYSEKDLVGKEFIDFIYPTDILAYNRNLKEVFAGKELSDITTRCLSSTGKLICLNWSLGLITDSRKIIGIARDITESKIFNEEKSEQNLRLQNIMDHSPDLIWSVDRELRLIQGNKAFIQTLKRINNWNVQTGDFLLSTEYFSEEYIQFWSTQYSKALAGKKVTLEINAEDSNENPNTYFETKINPIKEDGEIIRLACFSRDITEKKLAEKKIQELNQRLIKGQEISKVGYWETDLKNNTVFWSQEMYNIWGIKNTSKKIPFDFFFASIHPDDRQNFLYHRNRALTKEKDLDIVYRIKLSDDTIKYIHEIGERVISIKDNKQVFRGTAQEVTREKETEIQLKDRNLFIESTLNSLPIGIAVIKISDGEPTYMNEAFEKIYGWPKEDLIEAESFFNKVYPDPNYRETIKKNIIEDIQSGDLARMIWKGVEITTKTGEKKIVNAKNIPVPELNLIISTVTDDTERSLAENELKEMNERYKLVSEATNDAIWDWDIQKNIHFWGDGFSKLFGVDLNAKKNSPEEWSSRIHSDDKDRVLKFLEDLLMDPSRNDFRIEYRFYRSSGSYAEVLDTGKIIRDKSGKAMRLVGAVQDITERKEYEKSLQNLNETLQKANRELELSNKELEQFAYVASHDLQEPLRMISSFLGLIEKKYNGQLDEKGKRYIHFAVDGAKRMRQIIMDLLEFSQLDRILESKDWVSSKEIVSTAMLFQKKNIESKDAQIHLDSLPEIYGHRNSLIQLFQNLISNSLKYQEPTQLPEIWIGGKELDNEWEFFVKDNGIGIENEYLEKIFIMFQRLHTQETYSGTGIGLAICKKIVEIHQGEIWVTSQPGNGSTFYFTLKKPKIQ